MLVWCVSEEKSTSFTYIAHDNLYIQTVVDLQRVWKNSTNGGHGRTDSVPQEVAGKCQYSW